MQTTNIFKAARLCAGLLLMGLAPSALANATFTASGTWTCPVGVTSVQVQCWGGGGAGGTAVRNGSSNSGGGGGAGGAYTISTISVTPGTQYTVNVGTGGQHTATVTATGSAAGGGDSWFNDTSTVLAKGGNGGQDVYGSGLKGTGGAGGAASSGVASGTGNATYSGGNGANSSGSNGGGGGSSAGTGSNGNNGSSATGGAAPNGGGAGGNGVSASGAGSAGGAPGGGGGAGLSSGSQKNGGNGANGQVVLTYTSPTPSAYLIQVSGSSSATTPAGSNVSLTITALDSTGAPLIGLYQDETLSFYGLSGSPSNNAPNIRDKSNVAQTVTTSVGTPNTTLTFVNGVATITGGTTNGTLRAYNGNNAAATLNCSDGTVTSASGTGAAGLSLTVNPAPASKLVFTTASQNIGLGVTSGTMTVQRQDQYGNPNIADADVTVNLSSDSGGGVFWNSGNTATITSVTIPNGSSTASFRYNDTTLGTPTITASDAAAVLASASQLETISSLTWSATPASYNWNTTDVNWVGGSGVYADGLGVTFDDTGSASSPINIAGTLNPASVAVNTSSNNYTFSGSGKISGSTALIKSGSATLTISTANDFSGATAVYGGVIDARNSTALGGGATTVSSGAAVQVDGSGLAIGEPITLNGTGITNSGALRNLANANTVSGAITLASDSRINSDAGTLSLSGESISGATNLTVGGSGNVAIDDAISTTGTLTKDGNGTLTLTAANSYPGNTTVSGGVLSISSAANVQNTPAIILNGGDLFGSATFALASGIGLGPTSGSTPGTGLIDVAGGQTVEIDGVIASSGNSGANSLTLNSGTGNNGTLVLANTNTFKGTTTISNGVLQLANSEALENSTLNYSSGTLDFGSQTAATLGGLSGTQNLPLLNDSTAPVALTVGTNNASTTYSGVLSGTGATLTKNGTGTLTLTGSNSYSGTTTGNAGTLEITNGGAINGSALIGQGFLVDGGSVTASGTCNFNNVGNAFLESSGSVTLGAVTHPNADGILIKVTGGGFSATSLTLNRSYNGYTTAPTATTPISAQTTSGFYVNGTGANVSLGTLSIGVNNSSASARVDAGTVTASGEVLVSRISAGSTRWSILQVNGGSFTSSDTVNGIVIAQNNGGAACDGEVYLSGGVTTAGIINFGLATDTAGGQGYLIITNASLYVGSGGINQPNTTGYTSTISLLGGTLGAAAGWSSSLPMQLSGTSFTIQAADASNAAHNIALNGALSGAGALVKTGGGTLALGGADSYTGATTVSNGTLVVNGSTAGAGVDVLTNATLGGAGTIGDPAVTIEDGGHTLPGGALGNSGGATNTISGNLAYMAGAEADFNLGTVYNSGNDQIAVNGALSGNNVNVGVNFTGGAGNNLDKTGYTLFQVNGANAASFNTAPVWIGTPPANSNLFSVVSIGNNVVLSGSPIRIASATATPNPAGHGQVVSFAVNVTAGSYTINPGTGIVLNASPIGGSSALYLVQSNGTSIYTNSFTIPASPAFGSYALSYTVTDSNGDTISPSITLNIGGAPEVWNGNASPDNTWANALNWANGYAPETGDLVFFAGNNQLTPDMNGGYSISALTFAGGAGGFNITNDGASALTLTGGVTNNSADTESVGVPVVLNGRPAFNTAAGSIVVSNVVTDDGNGLLKTGPGTLYLTGANTYTGPTTVGGGALYISTAIQGNGVAYENFIVNDGATLGVINTGVRGMIENLTLGNNAGPTTLVFTNITAGNVIVSGGGAASVMEVYGDSGGILTLNGNCTVRVADTNGLAAGNEYGLFYTLNPTNKNGAAFQFSPPPGVAGYVTNDAANDVIGLVVTSMTAPVAAFSGTPTNGLAPLQVVFTNSSTGSYTNSVWNFGDGHSATNSTGANVTNTYAATGGYTVSLTVSGAGGVSSLTNTAYIVATAPAPVAGFTGTPTTGFAPLQVAFTNSSTGSYTNSVWSFGDGHSATNSTGANVTNTYAATGGYTVSLTVGGAGGSSTDTRTAYVAVKPAPALGRPALSGGNFMFSGTNGPAGVQYRILTATNIAAALTNWTPVLTNVFGSDGSYGYTNTAPTNNASFFILKSP